MKAYEVHQRNMKQNKQILTDEARIAGANALIEGARHELDRVSSEGLSVQEQQDVN